MGRAERVVGRFRALGEARQPFLLPDRAHALAASSQDLVRVALVRHVPDQLVARGVETACSATGQFHHTQPRAEMAPRSG